MDNHNMVHVFMKTFISVRQSCSVEKMGFCGGHLHCVLKKSKVVCVNARAQVEGKGGICI